MEISYLLELLDLWAKWMRIDDHKLGYPRKSIGLSSGGESSHGAFDEMVENLDTDNIRKLNGAIHSLKTEEVEALYARYLNTKKPFFYEIKLQFALQNLLKIAEKRFNH